MDGESAINTATADAADPADRSLLDDLRLLAGDARTLAEAEFAYQKSRAQVFGGGVGKIVGLAVAALLFVSLALIGLTVGLIIGLTPLITAWGATALVVAVLILLAGTAALWAKSLWNRLTDLLA
jgi:hypothetical protein